MTCEQVRDALLVADPDELQGMGAGEVAAHLRECHACRAEAARILAATTQLRTALAGRRGRRIVQVVAPLALAAGLGLLFLVHPRAVVVTPVATARAAPQREPLERPGSSARPVARAIRGAGTRPLVTSRPVEAVPVTAVAYSAPAAFTPEVLRSTSPGSSASPRHPTVLRTGDPNIAVLWFE